MASDGGTVRLRIRARRSQVFGELEFANPTRHDVFIEKFNACIDGEIESNVFEIRTAGQTLHYIGRLMKRRRPLPEDYVRLAPGRKLASRVVLTTAYEFPAGDRTYDAIYSAVLSYPGADDVWSLVSNWEGFRFTK